MSAVEPDPTIWPLLLMPEKIVMFVPVGLEESKARV
jgi:hypothetical protein